MNPQEDLNIARGIIADQQIILSRMRAQIQAGYFLDPSGKLVHGACGEAGLDGDLNKICLCFEEDPS